MEKLQIVERVLRALDAQQTVELVVLMGSHGTTSRSAGAWMAVFSDGSFAGTVGGGAVELSALREAKEFLAVGYSARVNHAPASSTRQTGAACPGAGDLLYVYLDATAREGLRAVRDVLFRRAEGVLAVDLSALGAEGSLRVKGSLPFTVEDASSGAFCAGVAGNRYCETLCPEGLTYVIGCGHVGRAVAALLSMTGFAVIACDERPEMLASKLLDGVLERRVVNYHDLAATCAIGARDFVMCSTSSHATDLAVVAQALRANPTYVGCMGSAKKTAFVRAKLNERGLSSQADACLHMPVGLPINTETPAEIAVSIAAEMVDHRRTVLYGKSH